ncbi:MAG: hypothetical protein WD078_10680 [Woeseia sp.]
MLRFTLLALISLSLSSFAQSAEDKFCANLAEIEDMSNSEVGEYAQLSEEYAAALFELIDGEKSDPLEGFPDDWAKHGLRVQVAGCYISGKGSARDIDKAMALLDEPAKAEYPNAVHMLASLRLFHTDDPSLQRLGFTALEHEYEAGSAYSAGKLGWAYQKGLGVDPDRDKALELYEYAAKSGMTYWQYLLAHAYEKGYLGLEPDPEKTTYWVSYKPKVHVALYECWVAYYYADGTFPANEELRTRYQNVCDETDVAEWWANFRSE